MLLFQSEHLVGKKKYSVADFYLGGNELIQNWLDNEPDYKNLNAFAIELYNRVLATKSALNKAIRLFYKETHKLGFDYHNKLGKEIIGRLRELNKEGENELWDKIISRNSYKSYNRNEIMMTFSFDANVEGENVQFIIYEKSDLSITKVKIEHLGKLKVDEDLIEKLYTYQELSVSDTEMYLALKKNLQKRYTHYVKNHYPQVFFNQYDDYYKNMTDYFCGKKVPVEKGLACIQDDEDNFYFNPVFNPFYKMAKEMLVKNPHRKEILNNPSKRSQYIELIAGNHHLNVFQNVLKSQKENEHIWDNIVSQASSHEIFFGDNHEYKKEEFKKLIIEPFENHFEDLDEDLNVYVKLYAKMKSNHLLDF